MLILRKIAVTGTFAAGKSTVCRFLREYGAYVVNADDIVHQLLSIESPIGQQVVKLLGSEVITDHKLDRKKISNIVFSTPEKLRSLESILHPAVRQEINRLFETVKSNKTYRFFAAEVPLLYEAGMQDDFDTVITVVAEPKIARQRVIDTKEFDRRSQFQFSQSAKQAKADYVITNQGDLFALKAQILTLIPQLCKEYE